MSTPEKVPVGATKQPYRGFTFKERLLPGLLLAVLAPLAIFFVAPFEIYGSNTSEFLFVLGDFWGFCLAMAILTALVLAAVLLLSRGKAFDILYGLIFGLSLMLFLQGNYLSIGHTSLEGDGTGGDMSVAYIVVNTVIWVAVVAACIVAMLLLNRYKDTVRLVATMATCVLIFMTFVTFLMVSLTTDVYATEKDFNASNGGAVEQQMLTTEYLDTLATDENVVVFLVDRFDARYYDTAMKECSSIFDDLDGFTFFSDFISRYPRTYPAVTHLITGVETDFTTSRGQYFETAYQSAPVMNALKAQGYDINLYTDDGYGYFNAAYMAGYASNLSGGVSYEIVNRPALALDMIRLSLYRSLPAALRFTVGDIRTTTFDKYALFDESEYDVYDTDMKKVYSGVDGEFTFRDAEKGYSLIHMAGCHLPNQYDEHFNPVSEEEKNSPVVAMKQSFKIISAYINQMKRMGVYEDATIVILGDHASIGSDSKDPYYPHVTGLMVKPAGATGEGIVRSDAPITVEDVFATILKAAGAPEAEDYGRTVFEIPEDEVRTRRYCFQRRDFQTDNDEQITYEITGSGHDLANWKIVDRHFIGKSIYD